MRSLIILLSPAIAAGAEAPDFVRDVQPILTAHCAGCHGADEAYSDFRVDSFDHLTAAIDSPDALQNGPSLTPGTAETSRIYRLMAGLDEPRMPPEDDGEAVPESALTIIKAWIDAGAPRPNGTTTRPALIVPEIAPSTTERPVTAIARQGDLVVQALFSEVRCRQAGKTSWSIADLPGKVSDLAFSPNGETLYIATGTTGLGGSVVAVNVATGERQFELAGHRDIVYAIAVSPDGATVATASYDREVLLWDLASGEVKHRLKGHNGAVFDIAFDPQGQVVASVSGDETAKVWDAFSGERLDTMSQPEGEAYCVSFTPDGRFVLAGSADNRIRKWAVRSRGRKAINPVAIARFAHEAAVTHLELTPDGQRVISASADRLLKVWTTDELTQLATIGPVDDIVSTIDASVGSGHIDVYLMNGQKLSFDLPTSSKPATVIAETVRPVFPRPDRDESQTSEAEPNDIPEQSQLLDLPARVKGTVALAGDSDLYAFDAKQGEQWIIEVEAARGSIKKEERSKLDSFVEVLDAQGKSIERVLLQAVRDSYFTFRGKNSTQTNDYRVFNWREMELGDLFYANGEVTELYMYPAGPDSGFTVYPGFGNRHLRFDTTGVVHALGDPGYIVEAYPPGSKIAANGLPIFPVYFENDDDSSRAAGTDSVVAFTPPADGRYVIRVTDARGFGSDDHHYTLRIRPRIPDFSPSVSGKVDKIQPGTSKEARIRISRKDGFEGRVDLTVTDLPEGFTAPSGLYIEPRQYEVRFPVSVAADAVTPSAEALKEISIVATSNAEDGRDIEHRFSGLGKLEVTEKPAPFSLEVIAPVVDGIPTIDLRPGETTSLVVKANRGDFKGRIQFGKQDSGRNLPFGVFVDNIGLNGLMIPANASEQEFFVTAAPIVEPQERLWHLSTGEGGGLTSNVVRVRIHPPDQDIASAN